MERGEPLFRAGRRRLPGVQDAARAIGTFICYDCWFPESFRLCALQGADIVCVPTNWVPIPGQDPNREAMANILCMAAAHSNSIFIAAADRVGTERGQPFIGQSLVVSYTGWPIGGPASYDREEIVYAEANLADARRKRNWNEYNRSCGIAAATFTPRCWARMLSQAGTEATGPSAQRARTTTKNRERHR